VKVGAGLQTGGKILTGAAAFVSGYNIGSSAYESIEKGTPVPLVKTTVREAGVWTGAYYGAMAGVAFTSGTGPGAVVGALIGGFIGGVLGYQAASTAVDPSPGTSAVDRALDAIYQQHRDMRNNASPFSGPPITDDVGTPAFRAKP
jgi:hypothetical protein